MPQRLQRHNGWSGWFETLAHWSRYFISSRLLKTTA
jgi:hypothetical protein